MASKQIISYGAKVERSTDGVTYTTIPECKGVAVPEVEQDYPEVTSFDSPNGFRQYIPGLQDSGEITIPCGYTSAGFALMLADQTWAKANGPIYYKVTLRPAIDQTIGDIFTYRGYPTPRLSPGDIGEPIEMNVVVRVDADYAFEIGS